MADATNRKLTRDAETDPTVASKARRAEERTQAGDVRKLDVATRAKLIRKRLKKEHGWTSKQVSVRIERYSMGSSINVTVKSADVAPAVVKEIADSYERVRYCEITREILSGGNSFVSVKLDHDLVEEVAAAFEGLVVDGFSFGPFSVSLERGECVLWTEQEGGYATAGRRTMPAYAHQAFAQELLWSGLMAGQEAA